jgi:hypothetical protein
MKIEVGDTVELNNGEVHEVDRMIGGDPNYVDHSGCGPFVIDSLLYHQDDRFAYCGYSDTLSVKRIISRASQACDTCDGTGVVDKYSTWEGSCPDCKLDTPKPRAALAKARGETQ